MLHTFNPFLAILVALLLLIGQWLRDQRCRRGWTIEHAAEKLGVDWTTLSRWERDKQTPHERNLYKISEIYEEEIAKTVQLNHRSHHKFIICDA